MWWLKVVQKCGNLTLATKSCGDQKVATKNMEIESWPSKTMAIEMFDDPNLWPSNSFGN